MTEALCVDKAFRAQELAPAVIRISGDEGVIEVKDGESHGCFQLGAAVSVLTLMAGMWKNIGRAVLVQTEKGHLLGTRDKDRVIDAQGFRPNVGIIIASADHRLLWGRRVGGRDSWQFPQGGMHAGESAEQAMYRELDESGFGIGCQPGTFGDGKTLFALVKNSAGFSCVLPRMNRPFGLTRTRILNLITGSGLIFGTR
jgi:hypothetical protein